jgi:tRNA U34 5-methylaminomethyl-2-thiouridine-forming methyltransferase MnmC
MTSGLPSVSEALIEKTADGSLTLGWDSSHVTYRSRYGAWTEAKHVFLDGTKALEATAPRIFEFGLGAATNLFATLGAFIESPALSQLNYTALECSPLPPELFDELVASYPLSDAARRSGRQALASALETEGSTTSEIVPGKTLVLEIVRNVGLPTLQKESFTSVYFDPFGPKDNPDAWTASVFGVLADAMTQDARLATYAAASEPRRLMKAAGLHIARRPGAGGKREMTVASKSLDGLQDLTIWPKKLR